MLEKPDIPDEDIAACLRAEYALDIADIAFLPLGADRDTAVYRAVAAPGDVWFIKLRAGDFNPVTVLAPMLLHAQGMRQVIAPLPARSGRLWARLGPFAVVVSQFVEGHSGFDAPLDGRHWTDLGRALGHLHSATLPPDLLSRIPREDFSGRWREQVDRYVTLTTDADFREPAAAGLVALMRTQRDAIARLLRHAGRLAPVAAGRDLPFVPCHADIHAGNVLIGSDGALHVVDWDTLILAPKERDLMFVGDGLGGGWHAPVDEERLFYSGYGPAEVDPVAVAYYRCERIVEDIAAYCEQILLTEEGDDRAEGLRQLSGQFQPGQVVELALATVARLPREIRS